MPNWCYVVALVDSESVDALAPAIQSNNLLKTISPIPPELYDVENRKDFLRDMKRNKTATPFELIELEAWKCYDKESNFKQTLYEQAWDNWGTKWDVNEIGISESDKDGYKLLVFDSAWNPPIQAFENGVTNGHIGSFAMYYWEPGVGFCGIRDFAGGNRDYGTSSDLLTSMTTIPRNIDECFEITHQLRRDILEDPEYAGDFVQTAVIKQTY